MEKNQASMSSMPGPAAPGCSDSGIGASAPPPPLPPSYEEAMAQSITMPNPQIGSINVLPYPGDSRVPLNSSCKSYLSYLKHYLFYFREQVTRYLI